MACISLPSLLHGDMQHPPPVFDDRDDQADKALRPKVMADFTGQRRATDNLSLAIAAAQGRQDTLDHVLLAGPPGLGKTTLAHIIAAEQKAPLIETSAPMLDKPGDLAGILSSMAPGAVLFIDEIHALKRVVEEYLYSAMEDYRISVPLGDGPQSNVLTLTLQPFTLVGATTREGQLSAPFRSRFGIRERLELYQEEDLVRILRRSAELLGVGADEDGLRVIARRSRGTARYANNHLRRIRDLAQVHYNNHLSAAVAEEGLVRLGVDERGLTDIDRRLLRHLQQAGRPLGLKTLAIALNEDEATIESVYEPYLIQCGFIGKRPNGREILPAGVAHLES